MVVVGVEVVEVMVAVIVVVVVDVGSLQVAKELQ